MSFEDKFKANVEQGNAELEKRRQALLEAERRERERRAQKEKEEQERREREAREAEERRRKEEERQRELERQKEEERQREIERREVGVDLMLRFHITPTGFYPPQQPPLCPSDGFRLHSGSSSGRGRRSWRGGGGRRSRGWSDRGSWRGRKRRRDRGR